MKTARSVVGVLQVGIGFWLTGFLGDGFAGPPVKPEPVANEAGDLRNSVVSLKPFVIPLERGQRPMADRLTLTPLGISVGKWPEGLALTGGSLWVAESGVRTLGQYDPITGRGIGSVKCGRLPVQMTSQNGNVYAAVCTDGLIWRQPEQGKGGAIASTSPDYPEAIRSTGDSLFVLMTKDGSSADSLILNVDLASGKVKRSTSLGANPNDLELAGGALWTVHNPFLGNEVKGHLTRIDPVTLKSQSTVPLEGRFTELATDGKLLFAAGGWEESGLLCSLDASTGEARGWADLRGSMVMALGGDDQYVVAADSHGVIHIFLGSTLMIQRTIILDTGEFMPQSMVVTPEALYLSSHRGDESGVVFKVPNWRPEGVVAEDLSVRLLKADSIAGIKFEMTEGEVRQIMGEAEEVGEEVANEVTGGFSTDWRYPSKKLTIWMESEQKGGAKTVSSVHIEEGSLLRTSGGIGIGASLNEVKLAYGAYESHESEPGTTSPDEPYSFVAGSIYGGVIFQIENRTVKEIFIGAGAE
ncbi:MAG: hypothetical protein IT576_15195 [Verrucomicrobiales bacterium]|nr:hypothetical protein [Verrucomicrobiales bacterium]